MAWALLRPANGFFRVRSDARCEAGREFFCLYFRGPSEAPENTGFYQILCPAGGFFLVSSGARCEAGGGSFLFMFAAAF